MTRGIIKSLFDDEGSGFITPEGATHDVFFHSSAMEYGAFDRLREGQRIEFTAGTDPRNPDRTRAEKVAIVIE